MSNLSTLDSIFDCSSLPTNADSLFANSELESKVEISPTNYTNGSKHDAEMVATNLSALHPEANGPSPADLELGRLKLQLRFEVLQQVSNILSTLAAVDLKYAHLARLSTPSVYPPKGGDQIENNAIPLTHVHDVTRGIGFPLVDFLMNEFQSGFDRVEAFIFQLNDKYEVVAKAVTEHVDGLTLENANLRAEVERLRRTY